MQHALTLVPCTLTLLRLLLTIFLLQHLIIIRVLFSALRPKTCSTKVRLALPAIRARLQRVEAFRVEAIATSADNLMAFFLSRMVISWLELVYIWSPFIHLLRNSCFCNNADVSLDILHMFHQGRRNKSVN